ncbi:SPFH domain-containing protein [Acetobacter nitrogenifigens]|uniref:Band 7 domain-containing protein n=1 Tax=Acetobacter nitrogenifigens DSM 23921 = NBRC 105050 TaxID=1120919 RepID=A0A511X5P1_9PROT|nr:SPFH domain-containing protein [Acetobacter nitrogenifigens]GEN58240.1 hypothetical protein ANI02nite_01240 [Acetobacter nitrogenifigens DSM 23921 = NBRC 105050]
MTSGDLQGSSVSMLFFIAVLAVALVFIVRRFRVVPGRHAFVIERLGVPQDRPLRSGLHFIWPLCTIARQVSLMQSQVEKISDVKTRDDAFIRIQWVLRYAVNDTPEGIMAYAYKVEEPVKRLVFKVENEIRQIISGMTMDELYRQRDTIAEQVMSDQEDDAQESGVKIHGVTIEQPMPPEQVQVAMNNKLAAIARKEAAEAEAEAERVRRVGIARAEAESKRLQGEGIANERKAIAEGFRDAMQKLQEGLPEASSQEILALLLSVNENDMVTTASQTGKATVIFVPRSMDYATAQAAMREVRN